MSTLPQNLLQPLKFSPGTEYDLESDLQKYEKSGNVFV
jgi:hypothetical protein